LHKIHLTFITITKSKSHFKFVSQLHLVNNFPNSALKTTQQITELALKATVTL